MIYFEYSERNYKDVRAGFISCVTIGVISLLFSFVVAVVSLVYLLKRKSSSNREEEEDGGPMKVITSPSGVKPSPSVDFNAPDNML